jgi:periplasmic divalent cation tolerance protein
MTGCSIVITTTDNELLAKEIARALIGCELVGCVQIDEVYSIYEWNGSIEESQEYRLIIKASDSNLEAIEAKIKELHNYDLPEIIRLSIDGGEHNYIKWLKNPRGRP